MPAPSHPSSTGTTHRSTGPHSISPLLRSTWDYSLRLPDFLRWVDRCLDRRRRCVNPVDVVRWNTDKHYLAHLADAGVPVVPSTFVEPGDDATRAAGRVF